MVKAGSGHLRVKAHARYSSRRKVRLFLGSQGPARLSLIDFTRQVTCFWDVGPYHARSGHWSFCLLSFKVEVRDFAVKGLKVFCILHFAGALLCIFFNSQNLILGAFRVFFKG